MNSLEDVLKQAIERQTAGDLATAAAGFSKVLQQDPGNWRALHGRGVISYATGNATLALDLIGEAAAYRPDNAEIHSNLGIAQLHLGQVAEALASQRRAQELAPQYAPPFRLAGLALRAQGNMKEARLSFVKACCLDPTGFENLADFSEALGEISPTASIWAAMRCKALAPMRHEGHYALGRALMQNLDLTAAVAAYATAVALVPEQALPHLGLGLSLDEKSVLAPLRRAAKANPFSRHAIFTLGAKLRESKAISEAEYWVRFGLEHDPDHPEGHNLLAAILREQGQIAASIPHLRRAIRLAPHLVDAYGNLAIALTNLRRRTEAIAAFRAALACAPDRTNLRGDLGALLHENGEIYEAATHQFSAIALDPGAGGGLGNLGNLLRDLGHAPASIRVLERACRAAPMVCATWGNRGLSEVLLGNMTSAVTSLSKAIALTPESEAAYNTFAGAFKNQGRLRLALDFYRRIEIINPDNAPLVSNVLFLSNYDDLFSRAETKRLHTSWAQRFCPLGDLPRPKAMPADGRPLRIGYVSSDFRNHVVSCFFEPLLIHHDRQRVEIYCYDNATVMDDVSTRLRGYEAKFRRIAGIPDQDVAQIIREDKIDILVDLTGHTSGARLQVFGLAPAPVQVTAIGYPNTTGLAEMDYRFTDAWADPPGTTEAFHTEKLLRLETGFNCYLPSPGAPDVVPPPSLDRGYVTFACFNNFGKVTADVLRLWAEIMSRLPRSRLVLKGAVLLDSWVQTYVLGIMAEFGVASDRIEFRGWIWDGYHLAAYSDVDIALDPFPYNGTTTTCDALWMGVPVVTLAGTNHAGRVGVSLLSRLGATDLIAHDRDDYVETVLKLAHDPQGLADRRLRQREEMRQSDLCNGARYTQAVEAAFEKIFAAALANVTTPEEPETISDEKQAVLTAVASLPFWYHKIPLPHGVVTPGWAPLMPDAYGLPERLDGLRVLDVGAWDGYWTFEALRRGASYVLAIDDFSDFLGSIRTEDRRAWANFDLCRELLGYGSDRCDRREMTVYDLSRDKVGEFDVVMFFGTLYHLRHPLLALDRLADVCRGEIYVESAILDLASGYRGIGRGFPDDVVAEFYPRREYGNNDTNWWVPSLRCLGAMMEAAGFDEVEGWLLTERALDLPFCRGFAKGVKRSI